MQEHVYTMSMVIFSKTSTNVFLMSSFVTYSKPVRIVVERESLIVFDRQSKECYCCSVSAAVFERK